ncbi:DUF3626 domain-containing protein [Saccharopolyspora sp. NFXS83]|uniref:DnaJ domain-containing protein n=1 Tax=Saccharopolyspora sp. NFXS83 TaxID=2993560 RepID=UPI00224B2E5D|nr:DnaJ domain-containing protein [Saccharopolyspora sp. NFXS83]MCX2731760.1 DUF3626 domain-containing protein [Saccharopolyspora sp. NFXS83]
MNVKVGASQRELDQAWRAIELRYPQDERLSAEDQRRYQEAKDAFWVLSDSAERARYDREHAGRSAGDRSKADARSKPEPKPAPQPEPQAKRQSQPQPEPKPQPKSEPKPESKPKPDPKPEPKSEPKPEPKPEQKSEPKPELDPNLASNTDHYAVLGAKRDEEIADIRKKWRKLLLANHPDKNPGNREAAEANTVAINKAWEVLSDPEQRARYDDMLKLHEIRAQFNAEYGAGPGPSHRAGRRPPERRGTAPDAGTRPRHERPRRRQTGFEQDTRREREHTRPSAGPSVSPEALGLVRGESEFISDGMSYWEEVWFRPNLVQQRPIFSQARFDPRGRVPIGVSFVRTPLADFYTSVGMPLMDGVVRTTPVEDLADALRQDRPHGTVQPLWGDQYPIVTDLRSDSDGAHFSLPPGAVYLRRKALNQPMEVVAGGQSAAIVHQHSRYFQDAYSLNRQGSLFAMACAMTQNQHALYFMRQLRSAGFPFPAVFPRDILGLHLSFDENHLVVGVSNNRGFRSFSRADARNPMRAPSEPWLESQYDEYELRQIERNYWVHGLPPRPSTEHRGTDEQRARFALLEFDPLRAPRGGPSSTAEPEGEGGHRPETPLGMDGVEADELTTFATESAEPETADQAGGPEPESPSEVLARAREDLAESDSTRPGGGGDRVVAGRGVGQGGLETIPEDPADHTTEQDPAEQDPAEQDTAPQSSMVQQALLERPEVDGEIDGTRLRSVIKDLVRDPQSDDTKLDERVDIAFSDQNLKDDFRSGLEGLHIVDLGDKLGRGPRVVLDVTELSEPGSPLPGWGDVRTSGGRERVLHQVSSSRAKARTESAAVRVPTPFVAVSGKLAGSAHQRGSSMGSAAKRGTSIEIIEPDLPVTGASHQARYRISVTSAGRRTRKYSGEALVDLRLKWPRRAELNPEGGPRMGNPEAVEHVGFSGVGGIYQAVRDKLGGDFRPNDPAELEFRTVLTELGDDGKSLLSGQVLRKAFDFANVRKPVDVLIGLADVRPLRAATAEAMLMRKEVTGGEISSGEGITFKHGGGGGVAGGDVTGVTGLLFGPTGEEIRAKMHSGASVGSHEHETAEKYEGPLDEHLANLKFVVDVVPRKVRGSSGDPTLVAGTVTSRLKPHNAEQHGWTNSASTTPTTAPEQDTDADQARNAPDRVDAVHRLPKATVDALVGPALSELAVQGHVAARELPRLAQRMRRFVQDHAREIARGEGVRFPLSALHDAAPDVFFHGTMDLDRAKPAVEEPGTTIGGNLVSTHQRITGQDKDRTRAGGVAGMGYVDNLWPGLPGAVLEHTNLAGDTIARKVADEQSFPGKGRVRRYGYPAEFTTRLGGTWSNPGRALPTVTGAVDVEVSDSPGTVLDESPRDDAPEHTWQDGAAEQHGREGDLPAGYDLDSLAPVPGLRRTTADMLGGIPTHRWREWLKLPFIGRTPARFDEHRRHWLRLNAGRSNEPGEDALNERNAGLGGLEVFSSPEERMAGFSGAVLLGDRRELKTHNHGGLAGTRELHGDISLRTRLSNPTPLRVDDHHWFADKSASETARAVSVEKSLRGRLRAGLFAFFPVNKEFSVGAAAGADLSYTRGSGKAETGIAKSTDEAGHYERGYLIRYDGAHTAQTSVRRRWESTLRRLHDGTPVRATKSLQQPGYAQVWVPASAIDQVGELAEADIAKLRPEDAERYRRARGASDPAETTPESAPAEQDRDGLRPESPDALPFAGLAEAEVANPRSDDPGSDREAEPSEHGPRAESPREAPAVRPPDDVGRGRGDITAHRLKAGGELADGISRELARWSRAAGRSTTTPFGSVAAVLRALRQADASVTPPPAQRLFDSLNDRMMRDSVWPVLGSLKGDPVLREMINGGWPLLVVTDQAFGRVEQLVVVRGNLGGGHYHQTIEQRSDPGAPERSAGHELTRQKREYDTRGFLGTLTAAVIAYPAKNGAPAAVLAPGGAVTYNTVSQPEHVREHTTGAFAEQRGSSHQFVHDLDVEIDVYPYASPGAYRKLLPDWFSGLNSPVLSEPWSGRFTVPDAIRSTVPVEETVPLDSPAPEPLAEQSFSLRHDQRQRGVPLGFSANAAVHVGRFEAPNLRAVLKGLVLGGDQEGRPRLRPGDAYSLLTEMHVDKLRTNLSASMSEQGYQAELTSGPLARVVLKAGLTQRKLHQVIDGSLKPSAVEERLVKWAADQGLDWGTTFTLQFREQNIHDSNFRPIQQAADFENVGGERKRKQSTALSAKIKAANTEHRTMYLVSAVPRWRLEPSYRGKGNPSAWNQPISTGRDHPIPLLVDRQGLIDLGFEVPGSDAHDRAQVSERDELSGTGNQDENELLVESAEHPIWSGPGSRQDSDPVFDQPSDQQEPSPRGELGREDSEADPASPPAVQADPASDHEIEVRFDEGRTLPLGMRSRDLDDLEDPENENRWMVPDGAEVVRLAQARDPESPNYRQGWDQLTPAQSWALMAAELRGAQFHQRDRRRAITRIRRLNQRFGASYPDSEQARAEIAAAAHEKLKSWPIAQNLFPHALASDGNSGPAPLMRLLAEGQPVQNGWERGVLEGTDASHRANVEWWFGYSSAFQQGDGTTAADPSEMPRYGAVIPPNRTEGTAVQWGTVVLHWNDDVRARTTFTPGDTGLALSDDANANTVKYTDKEHLYTLLAYGDEQLVRHLVAEATDFRYDPELAGAPGPSTHDYLEAQIHGPLDLSFAEKVVINWGRVSAHEGTQPSLTRAEAEQLAADLRSARPELTVELGKELGEPGEADAAEQDRVRRLYGLAPDRNLDEHELAVARELDRSAGGGPFARHAGREDLIRLLTGDDGSGLDDETATRLLSEHFDTAVRRDVADSAPGADVSDSDADSAPLDRAEEDGQDDPVAGDEPRGSTRDAAAQPSSPSADRAVEDARVSPEDPEWRSARVHVVSADGLAPSFEVRRVTSGGERFLAATVRLSLRPGAGVRPDQVAALHRSLLDAAERRVNDAGTKFPTGDFAGARFVLDVQRDDRAGGAAHAGFTVVDGPASDGQWSLDSTGDELLDGVLQRLGAPPAEDGADVLGPERLSGIASSVEGSWPIHPDPRLREDHPARSAGFDVAEYDAAREQAAVATVDADLRLPFSPVGQGPRAYFDVRRFDVGGERVVEGTLRLDLDPAAGVTDEQVDGVWRSTVFGVNYLVNSQGLLFPEGAELAGERLLVRAERAAGDSAHRRMAVTSPGARAQDDRLPVGKSPLIYAHEVLHRFGLRDENAGERRLPAGLLQHIRNHKQLVARHMAEWGGVMRHAHNTGTNVMGGIDARDLTVAPHVRSRHLSQLGRVISGALASPTSYRGPDHEPTGQHAPEPSSDDDDPVARFNERRLRRMLAEVNDYLAVREPDSTHIWRGADGQDRRGSEREWGDLLDRGVNLLKQWNAEHGAERSLRQPYVLENRVETLKRELELGRRGHRVVEKINPAVDHPDQPTTRRLKWLIHDVVDHATWSKSWLDQMGDTLGDIGAGTEHRGAHLRIQRGFRRLFAELYAWRAEAISGQPIDPDRYASLAQLYSGLKSLEDSYESEFAQVSSSLERFLAKKSDIRVKDSVFSDTAAEFDVPGRRVSAIRPANALDAAVRPVDPSGLRMIELSAGPGGMLWRTDDELLYREDDRPYQAVFRLGVVPWEESVLPSSLDDYQATLGQRTSFVSVSRRKEFSAEWGDHRYDFEDEIRESDRIQVFEIDAPGGIDLVTSLNRYAMPKQQEVVFPGGVRPEFIRGVELRYDDGRVEYVRNPAYRSHPASAQPSPSVAPVVPRGQVSGPGLGVAGVSYPGPSRPGLLADPEPGRDRPLPPVVHRGEFEVETFGGQPHVRLYTVVSAAQLPQLDVLSNEPTAASVGDVQQDPVTGKITVLTSQVGRPLSVIAGRPLSAVQLLSAAEDVLGEVLPWRSVNPPVIRSYLAPLDVVRKLSTDAAAREQFPHQHDGRTVNVWPKAGPNLFTVPQEALPGLARELVPGSMVTYTSGTGRDGLLRGDWAGAVEHVDGLRDRLGVPRTDRELAPNWRAWPSLEELETGSTWQSRRIARGLRQHYSTWLELVSPSRRDAAVELREGDPVVPIDERTEELRDFLDDHDLGDRLDSCADHHGSTPARPCELDDFMERTVRPWADQAAIVVALAEDHGRMLGDLGITAKGAENEFAALLAELPEQRARQRSAGAAITARWQGQADPKRIVAAVGEHVPELLHRDGPHFGGERSSVHRQRVRRSLGRYLELAREESDSGRVIPVDAVVKAILFRGIGSESGRRQLAGRYEQYKDQFPPEQFFVDGVAPGSEEWELIANESAAHQRRLDVVPHHAVASELAGRYRGLFDGDDLDAARVLVASDPIGRFHDGFAGADSVFEFVARTALRLTGRDLPGRGLPARLSDDAVRDVQRTFVELHQLHQAERDVADFETDENDDLVTMSDGRLFAYSSRIRRDHADLEALFATPKAVRGAYAKLFPAETRNTTEDSRSPRVPNQTSAPESGPEPVSSRRQRPLLRDDSSDSEYSGSSDSDDVDSGGHGRGPWAGSPEFRSRYPELAGVNAARYARGETGYTENCVPSVLAAWKSRATGVTVAADPSGAWTVGAVNKLFRAEAVEVSYKAVVAHAKLQPEGAVGMPLVNGPVPGMLHGMMIGLDADGRVEWSDPQSGMDYEPNPEDVVGYVPLRVSGATPLEGAPLDRNLLIGMQKYPVGESSGSREGESSGSRGESSGSREGGPGRPRASRIRAAYARLRPGSQFNPGWLTSQEMMDRGLGEFPYGHIRLTQFLEAAGADRGLFDVPRTTSRGRLPDYAEASPEYGASISVPGTDASWRPVAADSVVGADYFDSDAANAAFVVKHFAEFLGVNALPYARRVPGHTRNGGWSVLAGALTAERGTTVAAPSGEAMLIEEFELLHGQLLLPNLMQEAEAVIFEGDPDHRAALRDAPFSNRRCDDALEQAREAEDESILHTYTWTNATNSEVRDACDAVRDRFASARLKIDMARSIINGWPPRVLCATYDQVLDSMRDDPNSVTRAVYIQNRDEDLHIVLLLRKPSEDGGKAFYFFDPHTGLMAPARPDNVVGDLGLLREHPGMDLGLDLMSENKLQFSGPVGVPSGSGRRALVDVLEGRGLRSLSRELLARLRGPRVSSASARVEPPAYSPPTGEPPSFDAVEAEDFAAFARDFPLLAGVNGEKYRSGETGYTENCVPSVQAAWESEGAGITVAAGPSGAWTVREIRDLFNAWPVAASYDRLVAHVERQPEGASGMVLLRTEVRGMLHAALIERGADGRVRWPDPQRGVEVEPKPDEVVGYLPNLGSGATPLAGVPLPQDLVVGTLRPDASGARAGEGGSSSSRRERFLQVLRRPERSGPTSAGAPGSRGPFGRLLESSVPGVSGGANPAQGVPPPYTRISPSHAELGLPPHYSELPDDGEPVRPEGGTEFGRPRLLNGALTRASFASPADADAFIRATFPTLLGINPGGRRVNSCGPSLIATMLTLADGVTVAMDADGPMTVGHLQQRVVEPLMQRSLAELEAVFYAADPQRQRSARNLSIAERIDALRARHEQFGEEGYGLSDEQAQRMEELPERQWQREVNALYREWNGVRANIDDLQRLHEHPPEGVEASFDEVVAHLRRLPNQKAPVFLRGSEGMLHGVVGATSPDGVLMFLDGDRATVPDASPHTVVGMLPMVEPMEGEFTGSKLDPKLLVGAPAGRAVMSVDAVGLDDAAARAQHEIRAAAEKGVPVSAGHLAARFGKNRQWAFEQIDAVARADVLAAVGRHRPLSPDDLAEKYGRNAEWAQDVVFRVAVDVFGAELRAAGEGHVSGARSLYERFGAEEEQGTKFLEAAVVAEVRAAADLGRPYDPHELNRRLVGYQLPAATLIAIAGAFDAREAARDGRPYTPAALARKYGLSLTRATELIGFAALADAREAIDGGGSITVADLATRYGMSRRWAFERIEDARDTSGLVQPWPFRRVSRPLADGLGTVSAAARQARAEVRAAAADKRPLTAEELAESFGQPLAWAFDQIDHVAHVDVIEAAGRGERYRPEALAANYGLDIRWAHRRISDAFALEQDKKDAAVAQIRRYADTGQLFGEETRSQLAAAVALVRRFVGTGRSFGEETQRQVAAKFDLRPETVTDLIDEAARQDVIDLNQSFPGEPRNMADPEGLAERYARSTDWANEQIRAALARDAMEKSAARRVRDASGFIRADEMSAALAAARALALRTPFDELHRRRLVNAFQSGGIMDYERERDTDDFVVESDDDSDSESDDDSGSESRVGGITARSFASRLKISVDHAAEQIRSAASLLARAAAQEHVPYSADELGERFGKDSRWGFYRIGAAIRADARDFGFDTAALAERYGISVAAVEHHLDPDPLADVRVASDRMVRNFGSLDADGWKRWVKSLHPSDRKLDRLTESLGHSREGGLFWIGIAILEDAQLGHSAAALAELYAIDEAEAEHLVKTATALTGLRLLNTNLGQENTFNRLQELTGRPVEWLHERMEDIAVYGPRGGDLATHNKPRFTAFALGRITHIKKMPRNSTLERINLAAEADLLPRPGVEPYTAEELAKRYHMVVRWGADRILHAARDDARAVVRNGGPARTVEALARRRGIGRDVAERAIAAAVFDDAHAAGQSHNVAAFAQRYGLSEEALDRHRDALARLDVREAADFKLPISDVALAEKYDRGRSWAIEQIDAAAQEFVADAAVANPWGQASLATVFGMDEERELRARRAAARNHVRETLDHGMRCPSRSDMKTAFRLSFDEAVDAIDEIKFDHMRESLRNGDWYSARDVARHYRVGHAEVLSVIRRIAPSRSDRPGRLSYAQVVMQLGLGYNTLRHAALEYVRAQPYLGEPCTPEDLVELSEDLVELFRLKRHDAEGMVDYVKNAPSDSDYESS